MREKFRTQVVSQYETKILFHLALYCFYDLILFYIGAVSIYYFKVMKGILYFCFCFIQTGAEMAAMRDIDKQLLRAALDGRDKDVTRCLAQGANVDVRGNYVRIAYLL